MYSPFSTLLLSDEVLWPLSFVGFADFVGHQPPGGLYYGFTKARIVLTPKKAEIKEG